MNSHDLWHNGRNTIWHTKIIHKSHTNNTKHIQDTYRNRTTLIQTLTQITKSTKTKPYTSHTTIIQKSHNNHTNTHTQIIQQSHTHIHKSYTNHTTIHKSYTNQTKSLLLYMKTIWIRITHYIHVQKTIWIRMIYNIIVQKSIWIRMIYDIMVHTIICFVRYMT